MTERINFLLKQYGQYKRLLTVEERECGDLVVVPFGNQFARDAGILIDAKDASAWHGKKISQSKYSLHVSPDSEHGINLIKFTEEYLDNTEAKLYQKTVAIKRDKNFCALYARRCPSMNEPLYNLKAKTNGKRRILASLPNEDWFTPIYMVFAGPSDKIFKYPKTGDFNYSQHFFKHFSIVITWSFLSVPSHESSCFSHIASQPTRFSEGLDENNCIGLFKKVRDQLKDEYWQTTGLIDELPNRHLLFSAASFLRTPNKKSNGYQKFGYQMLLNDRI